MSLRIGIDVGGTFTDVTVLDEEGGGIREVRKVPSDPEDPIRVLDGVLSKVAATWGGAAVSYLLHGSTHALNVLLEEKGSRTGLLMTEGFRDVYEIGRQWKGEEVFNILYPGPKRFVPRRLVGEVRERLDAGGRVLVPLDTEDLDRAIAPLVEQGIEALAIVFLFSYINPVHEREAARQVRKRFPSLFLSLSSEVNPVWREYERTCATVLNAYLGPGMERYVSRLEETVRRHLPGAHPFLMKSSGGVEAPASIARYPLYTLMSGPVAGVMASHWLGQRKGIRNLISLDIGGTSCDMSLIPGEPIFRTEWKIDRHPVRVDSVEVESLGAGGGSLARVRFGRVLQVGPQSAGAVPGPACYLRGGKAPALTDALVQLGHLNPDALLGGEMSIDRRESEKAIAEAVARPLGLSPDEAALGILRVLVANVVSSMRSITIERGYNPAEFSIVAFGGMGPTLGTAVASALGVREVLVPTDPGNFSAYGMLLSDLSSDLSTTRVLRLDAEGLAAAIEALGRLAETARRDLSAQGATEITTDWMLDMRYREQAYELTVPIPGEPKDLSVDGIRDRFGACHERRYGHRAEDEAIEIVNLRVRALSPLGKPVPARVRRSTDAARPREHRGVTFLSGRDETPVFDRDRLAARLPGRGQAGMEIQGPAVIEEKTSTVVVEPGWRLRIDEEGTLLLTHIREDRT